MELASNRNLVSSSSEKNKKESKIPTPALWLKLVKEKAAGNRDASTSLFSFTWNTIRGSAFLSVSTTAKSRFNVTSVSFDPHPIRVAAVFSLKERKIPGGRRDGTESHFSRLGSRVIHDNMAK